VRPGGIGLVLCSPSVAWMRLLLVVAVLCSYTVLLDAQSVSTTTASQVSGEPGNPSAPAVGGSGSISSSTTGVNPDSTDIPDALYQTFMTELDNLDNAYDARFHLRIGGPTAAEFVNQVVNGVSPTTTAPATPPESAAQQAEESTPQTDLIKLIESKIALLTAHVNAPVPGQATTTTTQNADGTTSVTTTTTVPSTPCAACADTATGLSGGTDTTTSTTKTLTANDILQLAQQRAEALIAEHYRRVGSVSDAAPSLTGGGTGSSTGGTLSPVEASLLSR